MTYIKRPIFAHPETNLNDLGFSRRDYEGKISTLCAGCGHDSVSAALVSAFFELSVAPHQVAKLSGIGCSSKTPAYFLNNSHGLNSVHGRMPSVLTGANLANKNLHYLGISGDGDSASIGLGQFAHALRRGVNMTYIVENNGVYGLTKGQFSATADKGTASKKGTINNSSHVDLVSLALQLGSTFVARSFSGDKKQLIPILKAAIAHQGAALVDVISPCVAFNNHSGSTKSYDFVREHNVAVNKLDFITAKKPMAVSYKEGSSHSVISHDGTTFKLRKIKREHNPQDRISAISNLEYYSSRGEILTGLIFENPDGAELHQHLNTVDTPLNSLTEKELCPGSSILEEINRGLR